jgi:hypothetical protein
MGGKNAGALKSSVKGGENSGVGMSERNMQETTRARKWRGIVHGSTGSMALLMTNRGAIGATARETTSKTTGARTGGRKATLEEECRARTNGMRHSRTTSVTDTTPPEPTNSRAAAIIPITDRRTISDGIGIAGKVRAADMSTAARAGLRSFAETGKNWPGHIGPLRKCASGRAVSVAAAGPMIGWITTTGFRSMARSRSRLRESGSSKGSRMNGGKGNTGSGKLEAEGPVAVRDASEPCRSVHATIARIIIDGSINTASIPRKPKANGSWKDCSRSGATGGAGVTTRK